MNINVGTKIKELRKAKNLTQAELAKRIIMTPSAISSYENNDRQPSYDVLIKIAKQFNVTTDYLLGFGNKDNIDITGLDVKQRIYIDFIIATFKEVNLRKNQEPQSAE